MHQHVFFPSNEGLHSVCPRALWKHRPAIVSHSARVSFSHSVGRLVGLGVGLGVGWGVGWGVAGLGVGTGVGVQSLMSSRRPSIKVLVKPPKFPTGKKSDGALTKDFMN